MYNGQCKRGEKILLVDNGQSQVHRKKFKGKRESGDLAKVESIVDADLRKVSTEPVRELHRTGAKNEEGLKGMDNGEKEENYR